MCLEEIQKFSEKKKRNLKGDVDDVENQKGNGTTRMKLRSSLFCDVRQLHIPEQRSPKLRKEYDTGSS